MRLSGLKTTIAGTLVLLLSIALVLGNIVTVVFWQKSLVRSEVEKAQTMLILIEQLLEQRKNSGLSFSTETIGQIVDKVERGDSSLTLYFYDGKSTSSYPSNIHSNTYEQIVKTAGLNQQEIVRLSGTKWAVFSFGGNSLIVARPVSSSIQSNASLAIRVELDSIYQVIKDNLKTILVYLLVNGIVLSVIGLFRMFKSIVKPIERLVNVSESYSVSDKLAFIDSGVGSEFSQLSMALNSMLLRIEIDREQLRKTVQSLEEANIEIVATQREMVVAEKMAAVGRLSAGFAHEVGNPLGIIQGYVELLQQPDVSIDDRNQYADRALGELDRINRLIRKFLDFARSTPRPFEKISLDHIFNEIKEMFEVQYPQFKNRFSLDIDDHNCWIEGDRDGITQVLLNCLFNAADSMGSREPGSDDRITITASSRTDVNDNINVSIRIEDSGAGINPDQKDFLFEPFYTTKSSGKGTGLGLFVSHSIIEKHSGRMWIEGDEGKGAVVHIEIPQRQRSEA